MSDIFQLEVYFSKNEKVSRHDFFFSDKEEARKTRDNIAADPDLSVNVSRIFHVRIDDSDMATAIIKKLAKLDCYDS